ncbi:MAG: class I SAM-dependent methyltransferase [Pseudomonadota bacterium]
MFVYTELGLTLCALGIALYCAHQIRRCLQLVHTMANQSRRDNATLFQQLEALLGLYVELGLRKSLPTTRDWAASPDFLLELARHAIAEKPLTVVECSSGASTLVLARCMQLNGAGKVYSLEHDPEYAQATRAQLARHGLSDYAAVLVAPLRPWHFGEQAWQWYSHEVLPGALEIDMLAIDGPPMVSAAQARYPAGPALFHRLAPNGAVFMDDTKRADEQAILLRWQREFPHLLQSARACEKGCAVLRHHPAARAPSAVG